MENMVRTNQAESLIADSERRSHATDETADLSPLRLAGSQFAAQLGWLPGTPSSSIFAERCSRLKVSIKPVFAGIDAAFALSPTSDDRRWLRDNVHLIFSELQAVCYELKPMKRLPHARDRHGVVMPRVLALAGEFLDGACDRFWEAGFIAFVEGFQEHTPLELREIATLAAALKLALLERISERGNRILETDAGVGGGIGVCIRSLRDVSQTSWKEVAEPLVLFDAILRQDPMASYAKMDSESRNLYRDKLAKIARHSDLDEMEVAREALALARLAQTKSYRDPRIKARESHIGYYLIGNGVPLLHERVGFSPNFSKKVRLILRRYPDEFFLPGIAILTFAIVTGLLLLLTVPSSSPELVLLSMLILLLPSSQAAVQVMTYLVVAVLPPEILPKLDFSNGIPDDCVTLVAIPTLLLNEKQVRGLIESLEVRYLGNHDSNVHFALVSDLSDSDQPAPEENPLIDLCTSLIDELNEKYGEQKNGSFLLLHRHRVYNPREKGWMGWERKRGKLLDLNKLLRGEYDSFPIKVGDVSILPKVRFVITLDSDTELPRGSAQRMVGTLVHPLNQAIIDPEKNIVVAGYGILQPRVGVSVQSTARSRLAAIYAGETGLDIYTRAISDTYQDLYGEGSFTGKGIYEVDALHHVLDRRFPRNALLSHDLIEGAYARAGLASDIEVIEDYPSHYSAYNRRKHRWLRGDWQIVEWLTSTVPVENGTHVPNPISLISRWKILDNLRRSLVEPATMLLFLFAWLVPGQNHLRWTFITTCILFIPSWFEFGFSLIRALVEYKSEIARNAVTTLYAATVNVGLTLVFLAHQTLLSLDAVARAVVRRMFTRERLLEWETAAEAEIGDRRTPIDRYLDWMPVLACVLGLFVWWVRPKALVAAVPVLLLWACSKLVALWLNESPLEQNRDLPSQDANLLRRYALFTWRYFAEFSTAEQNWLIPDNVQEEPAAIADRVSPTNLGLLLNARQVAVEFGYLTVPEFANLTQLTLATVDQLPKHRGHLLNWYDTRTLAPLTPQFVSSVDSGNFLASLWTLEQGCLDRLQKPLLEPVLAEGFLDHLRALADWNALPQREFGRWEKLLRGEHWLQSILEFPESMFDAIEARAKSKHAEDIRWLCRESRSRVRHIQQTVRDYTPWWLLEFASLRSLSAFSAKFELLVSLQQLPDLTWELDALEAELKDAPRECAASYQLLKPMLAEARTNALHLIDDLGKNSAHAGTLANNMDFSFLLDPHRELMSVGYDVRQEELQASCYDLLATESRTAVFAAIAKEDIPQECWFRLGRAHTLDQGRPVLLSWTGTMFEYLMPTLWMRSHANTLLDRTQIAVVRSQQAYAANRGIPWGISESAYFKLDEAGNYQYRAFGLPQLALMRQDTKALVISPYSTFLALDVDRSASLDNLRRMDGLGWVGPYGFYESVDYTISRSRLRRSRCEVVRCWMAHHQGMSLLSLANVLCDRAVQSWFYNDRRVQATELLLHEKPVARAKSAGIPYGKAVA